ncbi:hypothetical protein SLU01_22170 [Sporosarcina luteola]|uniref:Uncharacterized protein n=1 Tax=Sporosarcina luteola TaxID=582850 RepID=A0A511Z8Z3_9BACL|nr:hypothetical protein SLU01_22170 [Sporosarcina luteola]
MRSVGHPPHIIFCLTIIFILKILYNMYNVKGSNKSMTSGVSNLNKYQKVSVYASFAVLVFFLVLSLVTDHWGFFLWSLLPIFMVLMTTFTIKTDKNNRNA